MARFVLIHGTRFDAGQWRRYPALMSDHELVPIDLPGHGARAGEPFTLSSAVTAVEQAVGDIPTIVVGHSLGGYVAAAYAANQQPLGLGLIGASADPSRHPVLRQLYTGFASLVSIIGPTRMARFANHVMTLLGAPADELPDATGYQVVADAWRTIIQTASPAQLTGLTCPVLIMNGQYDQMRIDAAAYAANARLSREIAVAGASHLLPTTHPVAVAAALNDLASKATGPATDQASTIR